MISYYKNYFQFFFFFHINFGNEMLFNVHNTNSQIYFLNINLILLL